MHVYVRGNTVSRTVSDCIQRDFIMDVHHHSTLGPTSKVDFYILNSLTTSGEREAVRLSATPVVLPAAADWLSGKITALVTSGKDVSICTRLAQ